MSVRFIDPGVGEANRHIEIAVPRASEPTLCVGRDPFTPHSLQAKEPPSRVGQRPPVQAEPVAGLGRSLRDLGRLGVVFAIALGALAPGAAWGADIHVPGDASTLQRAISAARAGDTI